MLAPRSTRNQESIEHAYVHYADDLRRVAARVLRNDSDARDAVHEVFCNLACSGLPDVPASDVRAYLTIAVRRHAIRRARKQFRCTPTDERSLTAYADATQFRRSRTPESDVIERLFRYLPCLNDEQCATFMAWLSGEQPREIALIAQVSINTVKKRLATAKARLRVAAERERERE